MSGKILDAVKGRGFEQEKMRSHDRFVRIILEWEASFFFFQAPAM